MSRQQRQKADKLETMQRLLKFRAKEASDNWGNINLSEKDRFYWLGRLEQITEMYSVLDGKIIQSSIPSN